MVPNFSEFSYGYALTEQLVRQLGPQAAAPRFPSLIEEGSLGYDIELTMPLRASMFLQFKLSDRMVSKNVRELKCSPPLQLNVPFYRMHFWRRNKSHQHKLLHALASKGEEVYYVAPEFSTVAELDAAYMNGSVVQESAFFNPTAIGLLPDDDEHHLAFERGAAHAWFCSDPQKLLRSKSPVERLSSATRTPQPPRTLKDELDRLVGVMTTVMEIAGVERANNNLSASVGELSTFQRPDQLAPYLARMYFNSVLILVGNDAAKSKSLEVER
jgi:hypothetical protein